MRLWGPCVLTSGPPTTRLLTSRCWRCARRLGRKRPRVLDGRVPRGRMPVGHAHPSGALMKVSVADALRAAGVVPGSEDGRSVHCPVDDCSRRAPIPPIVGSDGRTPAIGSPIYRRARKESRREQRSDKPSEETLDPGDWESMRALSHRMVDDALTICSRCADRPPGVGAARCEGPFRWSTSHRT
jgi:hypothetical protein